MPISDDAARIVTQAREQDRVEATEDLLQNEYADLTPAQILSQARAKKATEASQEAPDATAGTETPASGESSGEGGSEGDVSVAKDVAVSTVRGPFAEFADILDNFSIPMGNAALHQEIPDFSYATGDDAYGTAGKTPAQMGAERFEPEFREKFDEKFGTPQTTAGALAGGVSGQLAYLLPATRGLKWLGVKGAITRGAVASAAVAGATQGDEGNVSSLAVSMGADTFFDNPLTQALAIAEDDSAVERITKTIAEDLLLSGLGEAGVAIAKGMFRGGKRLVGVRKAGAEIDAAAARSGVEADPKLRQDAENLANLHIQKRVVDGALAQADEGKRVAKEAGETAEFRGEVDQPDPVGSEIDDAVAKAQAESERLLRERQSVLEAEIKRIDADIAARAAESTTDGRYMEAYRQAVKGTVSKQTDEALGNAATRNMPERPPKLRKQEFGSLTVTEGTVDAMRRAWHSGNIDDLDQMFGEVLDNTNYDRIADEGVARLIETNGRIFGNDPASRRIQEVYGLLDAEADAMENLAEIVARNGGDLERAIENVKAIQPDLQKAREAMNLMRLTEVMAYKKLENLLDMAAATGTGNEDLLVQILKWQEVSAHLTELRSGNSSIVGGALGDHRLVFDVDQFDELLAPDRAARQAELEDHIAKFGGKKRMAAKVEAMIHAKALGNLENTLPKMKAADTLGDVLYEAYILNILSSPTTQAMNIGSNAIRSIIWDPTSKLIQAGNRAILEGNLDGFRAFGRHVHGLTEGAVSVFKYNAILGRSPLAEAFVRGSRLTGRRGGLFSESVPMRSNLNTEGLARLFREGVPLTRPRGVSNFQARLMPRALGKPIGDWIASRSGPFAKMFNYLGTAMHWVGKSLAAGDELFASMAHKAELNAEVFEKAAAEGLSGDDMFVRMTQLADDVRDLPLLRKRLNKKDPAQLQRLLDAAELDASASRYAEKATYSHQNATAKWFEQARQNVPVIRWFAPFVRTPINLAVQGVTDFSPIGPVGRLLKATLGENPSRKETAKALGEIQMVGSIYYMAWKWNTEGRMTGGGPMNPAEREAWLLDNRPYSIKIGDNWYSYNRFDPIAMPLGIMADAMYLWNRQEDQELEDTFNEKMITVLWRAVKNRTFMQGLSHLATAIENPGSDFAASMLVGTVHNTIVPGSRMWATLERGGLMPADLVLGEEQVRELGEDEDEGDSVSYLRDFLNGRPDQTMVDHRNLVVTLGSTIARDLPAGLHELFQGVWNELATEKFKLADVPERDFFGDVLTIPDALGPNFVMPFQSTPDGDFQDPVSGELARIGYGQRMKQRFGELYGVKLTPQQREDYHMFFVKPTKDSQTIRERLETVMLDKDGNLKESWTRLADPVGDLPGGKRERINPIITNRQNRAKILMRQKYPELEEAWKEERTRRIKSRTDEGRDQIKQARDAGVTLRSLLNLE